MELDRNEECTGTLASGASFVAGVVVILSSIVSLGVVSSARNEKKQHAGTLYLAEALNWLAFMIAAVFISHAALDFPRILHAWRASRCA